ncbi:cytoplasmic 60S subunit biogenesis factor REI1 homolog 1-like isoform X2 [Cucurbita pepo subsp. pepo]|uniref:cytoplasmic 60S subunit biogenesis factor REI1 homolog 1-like isoform X2 n=1 Tax=Cucurbita pepo subsp. pepo TaxID=3664 RepID=UPI000C9D3D67|nr:cytoplasmic 60S subunit biogenesis factor REI1 homolog 1-like isoform X2 [Cucurbita pepo subsp. pepo]
MTGLTCNACNKEFLDAEEQKLHYKSEWHRYNLKRKVANVPGVTEALFLARQSAAAAQENAKSRETSMLYSCGLCSKAYRSAQAHAQHLKSRSHTIRVSQGTHDQEVEKPIIKPLPQRISNKEPQQSEEEESEEEEWEEVNPDEDMIDEGEDEDDDDIDAIEVDFDPSCCFMCDLKHDTIDNCMVHMHKQHGFFIPDVEYLKDPKGFLTYLGLKVMRDFRCLYCSDNRLPFSCLEAVRKHMEAKSHCKVHYGDGDENEEVELEEFYDYSSSYVDGSNQLVPSGAGDNSVELGSGGAELILVQRTNDRQSTKTLGSRQFLRYYRQKPRPSPANDALLTAVLAARYRSMGLATVQSRETMIRMKVMKEMNRTGLEAMRTKIGLKNNVIRNLPKNVPH